MNRRSFIISGLAAAGAASLPAFQALAAGKSGNFTGDSNHVTKGGVSVSNGTITLENSFWFDGAPDPRVGLGRNGKYIKGTDFAVLKKNAGKQTYKIPASLKNTDFDTVMIWCRKFSVPLGHAKLK